MNSLLSLMASEWIVVLLRFYLRNWQSGKEASDWVAATLEEEKRLTF